MARAVIVLHGGSLINNSYTGGTKDYIPIPAVGITFEELLSKLEARLDKDRSIYKFEVVALVKGDQNENMRMKVTDQFEWSSLMGMMELPTIHVNACPKRMPISGFPNNRFLAAVAPVNVPPHGRNGDIGVPGQWRIRGASQHALLGIEGIPMQIEAVHTGQLSVGSVFACKDIMVSSVHSYHLKKFVEFRTNVSDSLYYHVQCKFKLACAFSLRSKSFGKAWRVYELVKHTCHVDIRTDIEPRVTTRAVAHCVAPQMNEDGFILRPKDIQGQLLRDSGVRLKYRTALAGKNRALKAIYGDHDHSFQMIEDYLYMLEQKNPGSVVDLQTGDDSAFQYCFFALAASIRAFRACRPVIVIDATHLKGKYKGVLFVASTKDSNEQIVPLAFCIGDKEKDLSWTWFLEHIRMSFGCPPNLLIVSDQHKSIKNAVESIFPGTPHGFCTYHIQGNLRPLAEGVLDIFHAAANAYKEEDFEKHMRNLEECAPGVHGKLMDIGPVSWARCKCPVRRYAFGTSNAVEVLNARLKWARQLPVASLLEYCRNLVQSWFYQRRTQARARVIEVSEYAEDILAKAIVKGSVMTVQPISDTRFNIISGEKSNIVDLEKKECSCKAFDTLLLPCSHAAAAIRYKRQTPVAYVDASYLTTTLREIYADDVMPVPDPSEWRVPSHIDRRVVRTPNNPKQAGRPKVSRIPSGCESRGCPSKQAISPINAPLEEETTTVKRKRSRAPKRCRICRLPGHTCVTCKDPRRFV